MKEYFEKRSSRLGFLLVMVAAAVRFYGLDGGLVLGEPDEFIHQGVVENLKNSPWPSYGGVPWFFQLPLFPYLGYFLSFIFPQPYVALRLVSVLSALSLTVGIYWFFGRVVSKGFGLWVSLVFSLSPFSIYISRLALLDSGVVSFGLLSLLSLDWAWQKRNKAWSVVAGLFLTAALMFKYTALIYVGVFVLSFLFLSVKDNWFSWIREKEFKLNLYLLVPLTILTILTAPVLFMMRSSNPYYFKLQLFTSLGFLRDFWRIKGGELTFINYLGDLSWWLTWPVLVGWVFGLIFFVRWGRRWPFFLTGFLLTALLTLSFRPFYPRYFYPMIPYLTIFAALAFWQLKKLLKPLYRFFLFVLVVLIILPTSLEAFRSTNHNLIEKVGETIRSYGQSDPWIFASYWPNTLGKAADSNRSTWLTASAWDAKAFTPEIELSPLEVLRGEGGFAVIESLYSSSRMFIHNEERYRAWQEIGKDYGPSAIEISDQQPNFPHFRSNQNRVLVYPIGLNKNGKD